MKKGPAALQGLFYIAGQIISRSKKWPIEKPESDTVLNGKTSYYSKESYQKISLKNVRNLATWDTAERASLLGVPP
jgi:hypothetical protein